MKTLKIKCPSCDSDIMILLNDDLSIECVNIDSTEISNKNEISSILKEHNIEFG